jgi:hypothetical protein
MLAADIAVRVGVREKIGRIPVPNRIRLVAMAKAASCVRESLAPASGTHTIA